MKHPVQPLETDSVNILRFKHNAIVRHLLDHGGIDLNQIARLDFSDDDRQQFAQLIGYSLSGYGELNYVTNEAYSVAAENVAPNQQERVRIAYLEGELKAIRKGLKNPIARLFSMHPDDLAGD